MKGRWKDACSGTDITVCRAQTTPNYKRLTYHLASTRRGFTLVECLVFVAIWSSVSIASLYAIHEASLMRGAASQRAELAAVAQSELEHARALPAAELKAGAQLRAAADWWPAETNCTVTLTPRSEAAWLVDVQVDRATARGLRPVRLTSVRKVAP